MVSSTVLTVLCVVLPAVSAAFTGLIPAVRRQGHVVGVLSSLVALSTLTMALVLLWRMSAGEAPIHATVPWLPENGRVLAEIGIHLDGTSALMLVVVALVASMVQVYSLAYLHHEPAAALGRYFTWHSLFVFSMQGLVVAPNLLQLFSCWELVGLCSYLLIGFYWEKPAAGKAAVKAFWVNKFGDAAFLMAIILLQARYGTWDLRLLADGISREGPGTMIALMLFAGVMSKSAQFPLHVWLPDAMEGPTPVSALLHAATMVAAGVYLLVRFFFVFAAAPDAMTVILYVGAFTALFAALTATAQTDIKKVLAYSTCSQLGYMVAAIGAGGKLAAYFHLYTHAFFKALLFLGAGSIIHAVHSNEMAQMGGLARKMKTSAILFGIGTLAIAGIPPFAGFFSKDLLLEVLEHHTLAWLVALFTAGLTAYYMGKSFFLAFTGAPRSDGASHAHESGPLMTVPMGVLAVLAVLAGFTGAGFFQLAGGPWPGIHLTLSGGLALGLAVLGLLSAYLLHGPRATQPTHSPAPLKWVEGLVNAGVVDRIYDTGYRAVLMGIARVVGWVDRYVVDGVMNLFGWGAVEGGRAARVMQTGRPPDYVLSVVLGMVALMVWGLQF